MAVFSRVLLSGSTNGRPIKLTATGTPGTAIHVAAAGPAIDEVWLWATNTAGAARTITLEFGGVTDPADLMTKTFSLSANSLPTLICPGISISGGLTVAAFISIANDVNITGHANRIT